MYQNRGKEDSSKIEKREIFSTSQPANHTYQFVDNRPVSAQQQQIQRVIDRYASFSQPALQKVSITKNIQRKRNPLTSSEIVQQKPNKTGLPDSLKTGIEGLSGIGMDDVKVHYNSSKPSSVQAHAYTQGSNIHVASGQEKHLAHEAWHVVQQKQGRVTPTTSVNGVAVNDSHSLEREADVMGAKALL